jgi:autotransporter translocation and assembly factor TamB
MDRLEVGDGTLELRSSESRAKVTFGLVRAPTSVSGEINAGISWKQALPALDDAQPVDASVRAQRLEASVLQPLLSDFVSELQGRLDGDLKARLEPLADGEEARRIEQLSGTVALDRGSFVLTGLGFRLRDVSFTATAKRGLNDTRVEIPNLRASAGARAHNMNADVVLHLKGLGLQSGQAGVTISQLPLVVDGVTRANADAVFTLEMTRYPEKMHVKVNFSSLDAQLPPDSPRELTTLDENENITILQPIAEPKARRADDELPWQFEIHLGQRARVARGVLLDLPITGDPNVVLAEGLGVTGAIYLERRGAVQMLGKIFVIERGGVFFDTPDPKDPRLDVQATWRAPDGTTLTAFVTGTLSEPVLKFDRPSEDAWSMLLDQGVATLGIGALDTLLSDTPLARVQLRGQEGEQGTTYSAAYRVNNQVIVEGNYQATNNSSSGTDGPAAGNVGAAVDWRFAPRWSVRGQLGTIGTGVDLVYQYRY